ncbi:MAG: hypothetical protein M1835_005619 [Candelina submexicana]|nr:MAG: hypothetical protein M1835_005619 [Candelina submexicana]
MASDLNSTKTRITPRLIIHGGAGNITRKNLPKASYNAYCSALLATMRAANDLLAAGGTALDASTHAVSLLEDIPLFNAGKGAVFTRAGTNELEASVMVSRGKRKRGCGVMLLKRVKNPILLAREMLLRGEEGNGGGAQEHCQLSGEDVERLARKWNCEMVEPGYFFSQKRWDQHRRGLERESGASWGLSSASDVKGISNVELEDENSEVEEYLPRGTVGCVALDQWGTLCVATSTGGLTNKLPGRIGDTPTLGAGFWAEEWIENPPSTEYPQPRALPLYQHLISIPAHLTAILCSCLSNLTTYTSLAQDDFEGTKPTPRKARAVAMSGTGNGDSFLRTAAARTAAAITRFSTPTIPLSAAVTQLIGPGGEMQRSAGDRWGKTGEGEGGIIGIELVNGKGRIVQDFNCGGMFRAWVDDRGTERVMVFKEGY